jgi:putative ABC transport system permease protein
MTTALALLEKKWKEFAPSRPFGYTFISERYKKLYETEQKQSQLFTTFSVLAIFIASLGLFGLAIFNTMQRVKEIGIRKVLGASVPNIVRILSAEIIILVLIANAIAWPTAYYLMNEWLDTFAYRVDNNLALYLVAGAIAVLIALLTVGTQTIKAALRNPANTLRYE